MPRTILIHMFVTVPDDDGRSTPEIVGVIEEAFEVGSDNISVCNLGIEACLAEVAVQSARADWGA